MVMYDIEVSRIREVAPASFPAGYFEWADGWRRLGNAWGIGGIVECASTQIA